MSSSPSKDRLITKPVKKRIYSSSSEISDTDDSDNLEDEFPCTCVSYEKIKVLGEGATGKIYLVKNKDGNLFAMKRIDKSKMITEKKIRRVLTEREILISTKHPLVASFYDSFQTESHLCLIMEYCEGGNFYEFVKSQPNHALSENQVLFYAAEILLAIEYLHSMGIIYRDLKPENILLDANGHIRLTDFDLSKHSSASVDVHIVGSMIVAEPSIVTNSFVGTVEYIAPEVIKGEGYGACIDWWEFGILLYEMIYGVTPFRGLTFKDTMKHITFSQLKFPSGVHISSNLKNLIKKLLVRDPTKRLGKLGAAEIKSDPFFSDINFQLILNQRPLDI
jgi:protein-serine/threonine kinase